MITFNGWADGEGQDDQDDHPMDSPDGTGTSDRTTKLELYRHDGKAGDWAPEALPKFEFEFMDQGLGGPGSIVALIDACLGRPYVQGSGPVEGVKAVQTIDAM